MRNDVLGEKLTYYDAVAHLVPGTLMCVAIVYTADLSRVSFPKLELGALTELGVGVAFAYTLGHLLQAVSSTLEPFFFFLWGGRPSVRLLEKSSNSFSEAQRAKFVNETKAFFGETEPCPPGKRAEKHYYQRLFERCIALCTRQSTGRVESFLVAYEFHRALLCGFGLTFLLYGSIALAIHFGASIVSPDRLKTIIGVTVLTGSATWIEFFRARKRAYYYVKEVLRTTAEICRSGIPAQSRSDAQ
jgi:hypothetical protein